MIEIFATPEALADAVARHIAVCAADAIPSTGRFTLALAGGSTPRAAYSRLATRDSRADVDWQRTHVLWGDERCVPPTDPRSNYRMAQEALLSRVPIPVQQIHRIRGEDDPERASADYERDVRSMLAGERSLDLVLLGLGEDGHTASLFPGQPAVHETGRWVMAALAPDQKLWRVTLTPGILNRARNVTFVVSGANKAETLQQVLEGPFNPDLLPAQAIRPVPGRLTWLVDQTAAGRLRSAEAPT
jgi:6-phosphogluconolactonase